MKAMAKWSVLSVLALGLASTGCIAGSKAFPLASFRTQLVGKKCETKDIKVVRQEHHHLVLDVCGTYEDWKWSALNGWQYVGLSAEQPVTARLDGDADGILDGADACPAVKGLPSADPAQNGCPPPPDGDSDGIADASDACPAVAGVASTDSTKNGCPPDGDSDGIVDASDACPAVAGVASSDPAKNGCPADKDADGIYDSADACPDVAGVASTDPAKNGCPKAILTATEIVINDTIEFELAKSTLLPASSEVIDAVVRILKENADITKLEVQGHTDDQGGAVQNRKLSQERAQAVVAAMVKLGIDKKRLVAKGYGEDKPLLAETTDAARAKNRRVQFVVLKRQTAGEAAKAATTGGAASKAKLGAALPTAAPAAPAAAAPAAAAPAAPAAPAAAPAKKK